MRLKKLLVVMLMIISIAFAGTTGKLSGIVRDAATGEPMAGANVFACWYINGCGGKC